MNKSSLPKLIIAVQRSRSRHSLRHPVSSSPIRLSFCRKTASTCIVLSDLEIDRGRREAAVDEIVAYSDISKLCKRGKDSSFAEHALAFLSQRKIKRAIVPGSFPLGLAQSLEKGGIRLDSRSRPLLEGAGIQDRG